MKWLIIPALLWGSVTGVSIPALAPSSRDASGALLQTLSQARLLAEQGRLETAWETFAQVRPGLIAPSTTDAAASSETDSALLQLGRAFLDRQGIEQAVDVWQIVQRRGDASASGLIAQAIRDKGWPYWVSSTALPLLPLKAERWREPLFGGATLVSPGSADVPPENDPLYKQAYRYTLSVYFPTPSRSNRSSPISALKTPNSEPRTPNPHAEWLYQRFILHYKRASDESLARELARDFAVDYVLMEDKLGRRTRFDDNDRVHIWLVSDGDAGGEQWKNHLYFYALSRPRSHLEWFREAAHEYGHACLPGTSGFTEPEGWADGELGERLLLRWLDESSEFGVRGSELTGENRAAQRPEPLEFKRSGLEFYLDQYANPLTAAFAGEGWRPERVARRDRAAMEHVMGLALWAESAHGTPFLRRMVSRVPHAGPTGLWAGYTRAVTEFLGKAGGAESLTVAPVSGHLRFYLPVAGSYRLRGLTRTPASIALKGEGASKPLHIKPGEHWKASPGWYEATPADGSLRIERASHS